MALVSADRVKETSNTEGVNDIQLNGAVEGYQSFFAGIGLTSECRYCFTNNDDWEVGTGTLSTAELLTRDTVLDSSND